MNTVYVLDPADAAKWNGVPLKNSAGETIGFVRNTRPVVNGRGQFRGLEADIEMVNDPPADEPTVVEGE